MLALTIQTIKISYELNAKIIRSIREKMEIIAKHILIVRISFENILKDQI